MHSISILVLLYDCDILQSKTIKTISNILSIEDVSFNIDIVNNGPRKIEVPKLNFNYTFIEHIENRSLSKIYNMFITRNQSDFYIVFDQDTGINSSIKDLIQKIIIEPSDIAFPSILSNGQEYYPLGLHHGVGTIPKNRIFRTIASGLVISHQLKQRCLDKYGSIFDERFYLYGVDTSFCYRLSMLNILPTYTWCGSIEHSLSRVEGDISEFRMKERSYDFGLTCRHYFSWSWGLKLTYFILTNPLGIGKYKNLRFEYVFKAFWSGKHFKN